MQLRSLFAWCFRRLRRPRMLGTRGQGQAWEDAAERFLRRNNYRILERNFVTKVGEIDFVALDRDVLCFIEVKGRRGLGFGLPEQAVTPEKQRRLYRAAEWYLALHREAAANRRFDVISIVGEGRAAQVRILRNAFERPGARPRPAFDR